MHPHHAARNDAERTQPIQSLMGFGDNEDDSSLLPESQFVEGNDERMDLFSELCAAFSSCDRLAMDAGRGMAQKSADALGHGGADRSL